MFSSDYWICHEEINGKLSVHVLENCIKKMAPYTLPSTVQNQLPAEPGVNGKRKSYATARWRSIAQRCMRLYIYHRQCRTQHHGYACCPRDPSGRWELINARRTVNACESDVLPNGSRVRMSLKKTLRIRLSDVKPFGNFRKAIPPFPISPPRQPDLQQPPILTRWWNTTRNGCVRFYHAQLMIAFIVSLHKLASLNEAIAAPAVCRRIR